MRKALVKLSKLLSLVLRHRPEELGLALDAEGWVEVDELLSRCRERDIPIDAAVLDEIVAPNEKQRFAFSPDRRRIRASQGHSVAVDLGLEPVTPPDTLYHGTATRFLESILRDGLRPGQRQYVHLSPDEETAVRVGQRHGKPVVLEVDARAMAAEGHLFYLSDNGVWLTDAVPARYLSTVRGQDT